ncbi:unnamed protein product [Lymnaea stagnalis]|uniref:RING-type domain-containing protein n=1 Tax=Lymnaea stagnalis TaxID=6523 RepID=A0AAV2IME6_LYMST
MENYARTKPTAHRLDDYMTRLATFRHGVLPDFHISTFSLAGSGFYHLGDIPSIKCVGCEQVVDIFTVTGDPTDRRYHKELCRFITPLNSSPVHGFQEAGDIESDGCASSQQEIRTSRGAAEQPNVRPNGHQSHEESAAFFDNGGGGNSGEDTSLFQLPNAGSQVFQECQQGASNACDFKETTRNKTSKSIDLSDFGDYPGENYFYDSDTVRPECTEIVRSSDILTPVHVLHCEKNTGHYAYFPTISIKPEQIPSSTRDSITLKFLQSCSDLTVRLSVKFTSKNRPRDDRLTESRTTPRYGSGFMFDEPKEDASDEKSMKRFVPFIGNSKKHLIFIRTNRHLIFDQTEAENTTVEFRFHHSNGRGITTLKGEKILFSRVAAEITVILVCSCSDREFVHRLIKIRNDVLDLAEKLPARAKQSMTKKIFIIHHPHGSDKVLSYGDSVMIKYVVDKAGENGRKKLTKIGHQINIESLLAAYNDVRKVLLYAADTCPGSSGAPVIAFQKKTLSDGSQKYDLDIWMHNGVDATNNLGASVMKAYTQEDFESATTAHQTSSTNQTHQDDDSDDDGTKNQEVTSPVFKVLTHPSYPVYIAYQKRLESFVNWEYGHIHRPSSLALAGFFYAGYADCVRCFQCGLGLRSWKPGDDVYAQHEKHRPNCPFSQAHRSAVINKETAPESKPSLSQEKLTVTLLKKENEKLEGQLKCKVCFKSQVRDLFLPCGDLYACTDCSKLLTHCPSCNKQILATVTTYFI